MRRLIFVFLFLGFASPAYTMPPFMTTYPISGVAVSNGFGWATSLDSTVLTIWDGITPSANIQSFLGSADYATARTNLSLVIGTNIQAYDVELSSLAGLTFADASIIQLTGVGTSAVLTSGGNSYFLKSATDNTSLMFATPAEVRTALDLVISTNVQAYDADLDWVAANTFAAVVRSFLTNSTIAGMIQYFNRVSLLSFTSGDTTPDVTNGTTTLQPLWSTAGTATITDFDDGDDHSEFAAGDRITVLGRTATILDCSENVNLECNGGQDITLSSTQLIDPVFKFDGTRWVSENLIVPMSNPTTIAISSIASTIPHPIQTTAKTSAYTIGTDNISECYGGMIYVTTAAVMTACDGLTAGMNFCVATKGAIAVSLDTQSDDLMYLNGTVLDDGDKATNTSVTGAQICCDYYDATGWWCQGYDPAGAPWTDGGV